LAFETGARISEWHGDLFVGALYFVGTLIVSHEEIFAEFNERIRHVRNGPDRSHSPKFDRA
jgi:hypothetical protein